MSEFSVTDEMLSRYYASKERVYDVHAEVCLDFLKSLDDLGDKIGVEMVVSIMGATCGYLSAESDLNVEWLISVFVNEFRLMRESIKAENA